MEKIGHESCGGKGKGKKEVLKKTWEYLSVHFSFLVVDGNLFDFEYVMTVL